MTRPPRPPHSFLSVSDLGMVMLVAIVALLALEAHKIPSAHAAGTATMEISILPTRVTAVHDGDTFNCDIQLRPGLVETRTVRLPCGNAAELRADGGGVVAREALKDALWFERDAGVCCAGVAHLKDGGVQSIGCAACPHLIQIRTDWSAEKFGRLLADPLVDGASVCARLVDAGMVVPTRY